MNRVLLPMFGSKTIWPPRNATTCSYDELQKGAWAARCVQSAVVWASTRAIPISDCKPSCPIFGNTCENNTRTLSLSHYESEIMYHSILESLFMHRFHFWSKLDQFSRSDGIKSCLRKAKSIDQFLKRISRSNRDMKCLSARLKSMHKITSIWKFLWSLMMFMRNSGANLDFGQNTVFVFANSTSGSGINRAQIRICCGQK